MSDLATPGVPDLAAPRMAARATAITDPLIMAVRCFRLSRRQIDALLTSLLLPVMLMVVSVYLFGGAIRTGDPHYITYVVPGVLLLCAAVGASGTAVSVSQDMTGGIIDRFRSMNVGGASVLFGQVAANVVRNIVSIVCSGAAPSERLAAGGLRCGAAGRSLRRPPLPCQRELSRGPGAPDDAGGPAGPAGLRRRRPRRTHARRAPAR